MDQASNRKPRSQTKETNMTNRFGKEFQLPKEDPVNFDENAILDRYHNLHQEQFRQLSKTNMSDGLKQKLFGFSEGFLFCNHYNPDELVIERHPIKGRVIMTQSRHLKHQKDKQKEINIRARMNHPEESDNTSVDKMKDISSSGTLYRAERNRQEEQQERPQTIGSEVRIVQDMTL